MDGPSVPVDETSLALLEDALDYHFSGEDSNGNPIGSGPFSFYTLMNFWSGYDESKLLPDGEGYTYYGGPILGHKDVILALITEIRRLRNAS